MFLNWVVKVEELIRDTRTLKISENKAITDLDWQLKCFGFAALKVRKISLDLILL